MSNASTRRVHDPNNTSDKTQANYDANVTEPSYSQWNNNRYFDMNTVTERYNSYDSIFKGTQYYDLYKNNPYYNSMLSQQPDFWDNLSDWFGIHSNHYKNMQDLSLKSDAYIDDLLQKLQQDKYNSPIDAASRDRTAGLNPDLIGVSGGMSPAAEMDMTKGLEGGAMPHSQPFQPFSVLTGAMQCIDFGLSMADKMVGLRSNILSNDEKDLRLNDVLSNIVDNDLLKQLDDLEYNGKYTSSYDVKNGKIVIEDFGKFTDDGRPYPVRSFTFPNKKYGKRVSELFNNKYHSPEYKTSNLKKRVANNDAVQELAKQNASEFFVGDYKLESKLVNCCKPLADAVDKSIRYQADYFTHLNGEAEAKYNNAYNKYHRDLFSTQNGTKAGKRFNEENDFMADMNKIKKQVISGLAKVADNLYNLTITGNKLEQVAAMSALSALGMVVFQPMSMNFSSLNTPNSVHKSSFRIGK